MSSARADPQPIIKTQPSQVRSLAIQLGMVLPAIRSYNASAKDPGNFAPDVFRERLDDCTSIKLGKPLLEKYINRAATCAAEAAVVKIQSSFAEVSRQFKRGIHCGKHVCEDKHSKTNMAIHLAKFNLSCDFQEWAELVSAAGARSLIVYYGADSPDVASLQSQLIVEGLKLFGQIQLVCADTDSDGEQDAVFKFVGNLGFTFPIPLPSPPPPCNLVTL